MMFYDWKTVVGVAFVVVWGVAMMGVLLGASAAHDADSAAEASIDVDKHVDEVRGTTPTVEGPVAGEIEGTQLEGFDEWFTRDPRVSAAVNEFAVVPGIWFGMTIADLSAGVFYHHLIWVPKSVVGSVINAVAMVPIVGLLGYQLKRAYRLTGELA